MTVPSHSMPDHTHLLSSPDATKYEETTCRVIVLIPARLAATRLPDKPLIDLAGKPMIQHVWERANAAKGVALVAVATPDPVILAVVEGFGGRGILTSERHRSGTDRLAEAADILALSPHDIVVNVQGDEPLIEAASIEAAFAPLLEDSTLPMASLMCICPAIDIDNPNCVKVVCARNGDALYFSRTRLPFPRTDTGDVSVMQHIGLYAYRRDFLSVYAGLAPTPLERTEALEQLRVLENGYRIRMVQVEDAAVGVDTPEDLERARRILEGLLSCADRKVRNDQFNCL